MFCIYRDNKTIENINKWRQRENGNNQNKDHGYYILEKRKRRICTIAEKSFYVILYLFCISSQFDLFNRVYLCIQYSMLLYLPPLLMSLDADIEPGTAICS
jgi:hypothetical protein